MADGVLGGHHGNETQTLQAGARGRDLGIGCVTRVRKRKMPRKGKKGGGASEEEGEELLLRRRRAKEQQAEVNRKREELLTLFLTVKVQKEEHNSRLNQAKIKQTWRVILRQARSQRLRDDIIISRQSFERQLDGLDDVIKSLSGDLEEAERQCCRVRRLHLHHVERLRASLDERAASVRRRWEGNLRDVCRGFAAEERNKMASQRGSLEDAAVTFVARDVHAVYGDIVAAHRVAQRERVRRRPLALHVLAAGRSRVVVASGQVAALRDADDDELCQKREAERARSPARLLMSGNQRLLDDTGKDVARVRRLQAAVTALRAKLSAFQTETASEEHALAAASTDVTAKTHRLRDDLSEARQASRKRLSVLALRTDAAARKLRTVVAKGEKVLQAASVCSKIQRATSSWPHGGEDEQPGAARPPKTFPEVHQLTRRLNRALLQRDALTERGRELRRDNRQLRDLLRRRLDGVTLGGGRALVAVEGSADRVVKNSLV
ncbi:dynein regulatory complex subunit 2 isoform X1 [Phyllopteryx taeniolatus]|uniref:dynein regulatory complex subunit 2 isoform X1 n=1 Tax=Phyllopteryx taeniolatus TaxID=161469 RepID=UPI002AD59042|nr:dynein regulatory complex subunit 2 isoform X1 [Phyllopteryx taeniolatus]